MENDTQGDLLPASLPDPAPAPAPAISLEKHLDSLYTIICVIIVGLILTNLAVIGVFLWETKQVRQHLDQQRKILARFQRVEEPVVKDVLIKLSSYGQQDREFQAILQRYPGLLPHAVPATNAPQPRATVAPTNPAPAKRPTR